MTRARLVASGFGSGFSPVAPGTAGSLVGLGVGGLLLAWSPWALAAGAVVATVIGFVAIRAALGVALFSRAHQADGDPGWIVIDEIAGQMFAMIGLARPGWVGLLLAFALFRLLDITKPGPIGWADRQGGAFGVMADDVLAGLSAALMVWAVETYFPGIGYTNPFKG